MSGRITLDGVDLSTGPDRQGLGLRRAFYRVRNDEDVQVFEVIEHPAERKFLVTVSESGAFLACSCPNGATGVLCVHVVRTSDMLDVGLREFDSMLH